MPLGGEAVGVHKVRVRAAEVHRFLVHLLNKAADAAAEIAADDVAGLVCRLKQRAVEQVAHGKLHSRQQAGGAAVVAHAVAAVVLCGDHGCQLTAAGVERFECEQRRHDLRKAGGGALLVLVIAVEHFAAVEVDHDGGLAVELRRFHGPCRRRQGCHHNAHEKKERKNFYFFHFVLPFFQEYVIVI